MKRHPRLRVMGMLAVGALALSACGSGSAPESSAPASGGSSPAGQTAVATADSSQRATATAPATSASGIKPGTNHNEAASTYAYPASQVHDWLWGKKSKSPTYPKKKLAFLTFDDGPSNSTPRVLKELKKADVPASFFIIGGPLGLQRKGSAGYLKDEIAQGHSVCIHSYSHSFSQLYPGRKAHAAAISKDYDRTVSAVRAVLGQDYKASCQRYPGGHGWNSMGPADAALKRKGAYWIDWNSENGDGTDTASSSGAGRAAQALSTIGSDTRVAVILMHDYKDNDATIESIAPLVTSLKSKGYEFGVMQ